MFGGEKQFRQITDANYIVYVAAKFVQRLRLKAAAETHKLYGKEKTRAIAKQQRQRRFKDLLID